MGIIETVFAPGTCEPGLDVITSPILTIIDQYEALPEGSIWMAGMFEAGMFDLCVRFNELLDRFEAT
jgi:hypothetical protein